MSTTARTLPEDMLDMLTFHFTYLSLWIAYLSIYLKPEKGTLVGQKLSVEFLLIDGGVLVYSTCTITPQENEEQVAWAWAW